jgi:hypothetical protein
MDWRLRLFVGFVKYLERKQLLKSWFITVKHKDGTFKQVK